MLLAAVFAAQAVAVAPEVAAVLAAEPGAVVAADVAAVLVAEPDVAAGYAEPVAQAVEPALSVALVVLAAGVPVVAAQSC